MWEARPKFSRVISREELCVDIRLVLCEHLGSIHGGSERNKVNGRPNSRERCVIQILGGEVEKVSARSVAEVVMRAKRA